MYVGRSGHDEMGEVKSRPVAEGAEKMEGAEIWGLGEVNVDELYKYFLD